MKVISPDEFSTGLYERIDQAPDKVTLWLDPETQTWWALVLTTAHEIEDVQSVAVAYQLDKSERADTAVIRWANAAAARAAHPEDET